VDPFDRVFWCHFLGHASATRCQFDNTVFQAARADSDAPWQANQIHRGEFATCAFIAIIIERLKPKRSE
jgi:hypothetical protein